MPLFRIVYGPTRRSALPSTVERSFRTTLSNRITSVDGYGLFVRRQLTQQWDIELGATRESHDYIQVLGTQGQPQEGQWESLVTGNATLGYNVGPRTRMILGLVYSDRRSDVSARRYDGLRVGVSMIYSF